jgi:hypothetical protein
LIVAIRLARAYIGALVAESIRPPNTDDFAVWVAPQQGGVV